MLVTVTPKFLARRGAALLWARGVAAWQSAELPLHLWPTRIPGQQGRQAQQAAVTVEEFPSRLSCPQAPAAPPRRGGAIGRSSIVATLEGKSLIYCAFPLTSGLPAASRARTGPAGLRKPKLSLLGRGLELDSDHFSTTSSESARRIRRPRKLGKVSGSSGSSVSLSGKPRAAEPSLTLHLPENR